MIPLAFVRAAFEEREAIRGKYPWFHGLTCRAARTRETVQRTAHKQRLARNIVPSATCSLTPIWAILPATKKFKARTA